MNLAEERTRFLTWLDAQQGTPTPQQAQGAAERLYYLLGSAAQAQYRATGRLFPARDTLGMAALLQRGGRLGVLGTDLVASALAGASRGTAPAAMSGGTLALWFAPPEYTVRSRRGWSVRFPFYVMISAAQTATPNNGVETETLFLSTLFARNRGVPGESQATILVNAAQRPASDTAFTGFWLKAFGVTAGDRVHETPLAGATAYRRFDAAQNMNEEVVIVGRGRLTFVFAYLGLPGTYEANRAEFLALLRTLAVDAGAPAGRRPSPR